MSTLAFDDVHRMEITIHRPVETVSWLMRCQNKQYWRVGDLLESAPALMSFMSKLPDVCNFGSFLEGEDLVDVQRCNVGVDSGPHEFTDCAHY